MNKGSFHGLVRFVSAVVVLENLERQAWACICRYEWKLHIQYKLLLCHMEKQ